MFFPELLDAIKYTNYNYLSHKSFFLIYREDDPFQKKCIVKRTFSKRSEIILYLDDSDLCPSLKPPDWLAYSCGDLLLFRDDFCEGEYAFNYISLKSLKKLGWTSKLIKKHLSNSTEYQHKQFFSRQLVKELQDSNPSLKELIEHNFWEQNIKQLGKLKEYRLPSSVEISQLQDIEIDMLTIMQEKGLLKYKEFEYCGNTYLIDEWVDSFSESTNLNVFDCLFLDYERIPPEKHHFKQFSKEERKKNLLVKVKKNIGKQKEHLQRKQFVKDTFFIKKSWANFLYKNIIIKDVGFKEKRKKSFYKYFPKYFLTAFKESNLDYEVLPNNEIQFKTNVLESPLLLSSSYDSISEYYDSISSLSKYRDLPSKNEEFNQVINNVDLIEIILSVMKNRAGIYQQKILKLVTKDVDTSLFKFLISDMWLEVEPNYPIKVKDFRVAYSGFDSVENKFTFPLWEIELVNDVLNYLSRPEKRICFFMTLCD